MKRSYSCIRCCYGFVLGAIRCGLLVRLKYSLTWSLFLRAHAHQMFDFLHVFETS